jgi:putative DNA primase/helicase
MGAEKRGWYRLSEWAMDSGTTMLVGTYGVFQGDDAGTRKIDLSKRCEDCGFEMALKEKKCPKCGSGKYQKRELTDEQKAALRAKQAEDKKRADAERRAEINRAASWAGAVWRKCREAVPADHDYFGRKHLSTTGGARIFDGLKEGLSLDGAQPDDYKYLASFNGALVVPMCDPSGKVFGLQFILSRQLHQERISRTERDKEFWPSGMSAEAKYWMVGGTPNDIGLECEGYATGITLHEATGRAVAIAFTAGNLPKVANELKRHYRKQARYLVCADDDWLQKCAECGKYTSVETDTCAHCGKHHRKTNAGVARATETALAVPDCAWIKPTFTTDRPADKKGPTDFNDLHCLEGLNAVRAQIEARVDALGWGASAPALVERCVEQEGEGGRAAIPSMLQIDEALERFALVYGGKSTMYDHVEHMLVPKADVLDILPEHGWRDMRAHKKVVRIDEIGFDPGGKDRRITCNLWGGWPTKPKAGTCAVLLSLLEYLCSEEENGMDVYLWVLRWLAYPIQNPGAKMRTALVFHGPQGAGKNLFFETVMGIYGEYGRIVDQSAIEDKFNDWASRKLFLIADEVVAQAELYHVKNKLKSFITGEWIRINPKNVTAHDEKNHVNLVFLSNEHKPLQLEKDDRRFTVVWTPEKLPESFYSTVKTELDNGGQAALHDYLLNLDMDGFNEHSKPPMTGAKRDLIDVSLGSVERFVREWEMGEIFFSAQSDKNEPLPFCPCYRSDLYLAYTRWCRSDGVKNPRESSQFYGYIAKLPGWENKQKERYANTHYTGKTLMQRMVIPSVEAMESASRSSRKDLRRPLGKTQAQWLTDCYFEFSNALGDPS